MTRIEDVRRALERMGLVGKRVAIHSSLRSFGGLEGGAEELLALIRRNFDTVMMPAFSFESNAPPPAGDRPSRNGTDYTFYDGWNRPPVPFIVQDAPVDRKMGALSRLFSAQPGVERSDHPWHSWACVGSGSAEIVADHAWSTTNLPLERLAAHGGWVLLLGVGLSSCTALHIAEERAGRRPFIRWASRRDGGVARMRVAGCAKGFDALTPRCEPLLVRDQAGASLFVAAPLAQLIERAAAIMTTDPELTRCSPKCLRCADAIAGGPTD